MAKVGDTVKIIRMADEPAYNGKIGVITNMSPEAWCGRTHIYEQWYGTWGGIAIQPANDEYEIIKEA